MHRHRYNISDTIHTNGEARQRLRRLVPALALPGAIPEETDTELEESGNKSARRGGVTPLRFFPRLFPVPTKLYGILTIIAGTILVAALFFEVREVLSPFILALIAGILFYPFRNEQKLRPLMLAGALVFLIWFTVTTIGVLLPFILAFGMAYIVDPLVTWLQRKYFVKRWIPALMVTLILLGLIVLIVGYLLPLLAAQVAMAIGSIETLSTSLVAWARSGDLANLLGAPQEKIDVIVERYLIPKTQGIQAKMLEEVEGVAVGLPGYLAGIFNFLAVPFVMFYFIKDYWHIRGAIYSFIPQEYQRRSQRFLKDLDEIVGGFLRGDIITSVFQGTFIGVGLHFIGVPQALLLGVLTGFLCLIPYIGAIIALMLAMLFALYTPDPGLTVLYVGILYALQSILESTVIGPQIMGKHTELHPLLVIISLIIFGSFMGTTGMLIAIPTTGLVLRYVSRWRDRRRAGIEQEKVQADIERNPHHAGRATAMDSAAAGSAPSVA